VNDDHSRFTFEVEGSVTGPDGSGSNSADFISNSGRVRIQKEDWDIYGAHLYFGVTISNGYQIKWKTIAQGQNKLVPAQRGDGIENVETIFQGVANTRHKLKIVCQGDKSSLKSVRAYRPFLNRKYYYNETYNLTITANGNGSVTPAGTYSYNKNEVVRIYAIPEEGYEFYNWEGTDNTSDYIDVTMDGDKTVTAIFGLPRVTLTTFAGFGGSVNPSGYTEIPTGNEAMVVAVPDPGYKFMEWEGDVTTDQKYEDTIYITMNKNKYLTAYFTESTGGINDHSDQYELEIYPVPAKGYLKLKFSGLPDEYYEIRNITGIIIQQGSVKHEINVERIQPGVYVFICYINEKRYSRRIMIR